jgi:uncharacterized membrane protein YqjE
MPDSSGMVQGWLDLLQSLGQALLGVLRAEAAALGMDFRRSAIHLGRGLALLGGAAAMLYWTLGIMVLVLIALFAIWLPIWASALIVAAIFLLTAALLIYLAWRQLRQLESPLDDIQRRVSDHLDWWQNRLLALPAEALPAVPSAAAPTAQAGAPPPLGGPPRIHPDDPLENDDR